MLSYNVKKRRGLHLQYSVQLISINNLEVVGLNQIEVEFQ